MSKIIHHPVDNVTMRLIKSEDLNHHGTLFAGRTAEWFVESGFIASTSLLDPKNVVCLKVHGMHFTSPANPGEVLKFDSKIVYTGRSSLVAYITRSPDQRCSPGARLILTIHQTGRKEYFFPYSIICPRKSEQYSIFTSVILPLRSVTGVMTGLTNPL